jgi:hypothetical protein
MAKHRKFNIDRFLVKFEDHEEIFSAYAWRWKVGLNIDISTLDVDGFRNLILGEEWSDKDLFMEGLYRAYDLCTPDGLEALRRACAALPKPPDPKEELAVEPYSLKVLATHEDAFNRAYAECSLQKAERFSIYQGKEGRPIKDIKEAAARLHERLAADFKGRKNSDSVLVLPYEEDGYVNFIVYHEKRTQSLLTFKRARRKIKVSPTVLRPAQQDFISYNSKTGQVEIETQFEKDEETLRKRFAECCLEDASFFEGPEASNRFKLGVIADDAFSVDVDEPDKAALVELHFGLPQTHGPSFVVRSQNVVETLRINELKHKLRAEQIKRAVFRVTFSDDKRGKRVELSGTNTVSFKRATNAEKVFEYLRLWKILVERKPTPANLEADGLNRVAGNPVL